MKLLKTKTYKKMLKRNRELTDANEKKLFELDSAKQANLSLANSLLWTAILGIGKPPPPGSGTFHLKHRRTPLS